MKLKRDKSDGKEVQIYFSNMEIFDVDSKGTIIA